VYIIDGYNVIMNLNYAHKNGSIEAARDHFLTILSSYRVKKRVGMTVVWDGKESVYSREEWKNGVKSIYTAPYISADEKIVKLVEGMKNKRRVTVVSNDRRHITGIIRNLGVKSMSVDEFLSLTGGQRREKKRYKKTDSCDHEISTIKKRANDLSVDDWMRLFHSKE